MSLAAILSLSYIQASKSYLITYFYMSIVLLILITLLAVYGFNRKAGKYQEIMENYNKTVKANPRRF